MSSSLQAHDIELLSSTCLYLFCDKIMCHGTGSQMYILTDVLDSDVLVHAFSVNIQMLLNKLELIEQPSTLRKQMMPFVMVL